MIMILPLTFTSFTMCLMHITVTKLVLWHRKQVPIHFCTSACAAFRFELNIILHYNFVWEKALCSSSSYFTFVIYPIHEEVGLLPVIVIGHLNNLLNSLRYYLKLLLMFVFYGLL